MGSGSSTKSQNTSKSTKKQVTNLDIVKNKATFVTVDQNKRAFKLKNELYIEQQKIGSGSFADVYLYKNSSNGSLRALKILKDNTTSKAFLQECQIMRDVESQFVIRIEEIIKIDDQLCIMMEYANQGTLDNFISSVTHQTISINANQILDLVCDIFQGLDIMHAKKIIHRDLKMDNLLVSNYQIKIADLGVATYLISKSFAQTNIGNILYAAPEKMNENENYNSSSDIFSAGLIILQMILSLNNVEIIKMKINDNYTNQIQNSPESLRSFIEQLLNKIPGSRPTAMNAFNLARKLKYDSEVISYINNKISGATSVQNFQNQQNKHLSSQPQLSKQNIQVEFNLLNSDSTQLEDQLFQKGMEYYWGLEIESAEQQFAMILEQNPVSVDALAGRVLCGDYYQHWINKNKKYTNVWIQNQLKYIQQLNPNHSMYFFCLGIIDKDLDSIDKFIELKPLIAEAIAVKATLLIDQKRVEDAIKLGQKALEMSGNNAFILRRLGYIYYDINKDTSEKFFLRSLYINPNQYIVLYNLVTIFREKNILDKARENIDKSLSSCPYYKYSIILNSKLLQDQNKHKEVIDYILNVLKMYGEQDSLFFNLAFSYKEIGDLQNALLYYTKSLIYDENNINTLLNMGNIYTELKDQERAQEYYQKGIDNRDKRCYLQMFYQLRDQPNQLTKGEEYLKQLLKLDLDTNVEQDCKFNLIALAELKQQKEFLTLSEIALKKHPSSLIISNTILIEIRNENFKESLPLQFKLSQLIQNSKGICIDTTMCQIKYFSSNNMKDLIVPHILKYYEYEINNKGMEITDFTVYQTFKNYINKDNIKDLFQGTKKLYEQNSNNLHFLVIFLSLITLKELYFSYDMLSEIDQIYKTNAVFVNYSDKDKITQVKIVYKRYQMYYYLSWFEPSEIKKIFQEYLKQCESVTLTFKEKYENYYGLYSDLNGAIKNNGIFQFNQKELENYKKLLFSLKNEGTKLHPDSNHKFD